MEEEPKNISEQNENFLVQKKKKNENENLVD